MLFEITTPSGEVVEVDTAHDDQYLKDIQERGYKVVKKLNVCTSCEG